MLSAINSSQPSFTSVVPMRVFIDGLETFDTKKIQVASRQLTKILFGPAKGNDEFIVRKFAKYDPDYSLNFGLSGYPNMKNNKKLFPSDFFRAVVGGGLKDSYLVTGEHAKTLKTLGRTIGNEKKVCNERNIPISYDVKVAKQNYWFVLKNIISSPNIRLKETLNPKTKGKPVALKINMESNGQFNPKDFSMSLKDIDFI